ncbi:MAG: hypothetical protein RMJ44_08550 [Cytophagales bacterium]|nr:hypothetical protein [Bernardetiaceae bacterium]MDW8211122.1 hypothetical protein [Cytophagales bacterium]
MNTNRLLATAALIATIAISNSCKERVIQIPPPDFAQIMVDNGPFIGFKSTNDQDFSRYTQVVVRKAPVNNEVIFEETFVELGQPRTIKYTVKFVRVGSNGVELTIERQQISPTESIVGVNMPGETNPTSIVHGQFIGFDANKQKVNKLQYALATNPGTPRARRWLYDFPQPCPPNRPRWNGSDCVP